MICARCGAPNAHPSSNLCNVCFHYACSRSQCSSPNCLNLALSDMKYCNMCAWKVICQNCAAYKPYSETQKYCFSCVKINTYKPCPSQRNCNGLCGFDKLGNSYAFCVLCACKNKPCEGLAIENEPYCLDCKTSPQSALCAATNCSRTVIEGFTYCKKCDAEYRNGRVLCVMDSCRTYKSIKHPFPYCRECSKVVKART